MEQDAKSQPPRDPGKEAAGDVLSSILFAAGVAALLALALFQFVALPRVVPALPPSKITPYFLQTMSFVRFFLGAAGILGLAAGAMLRRRNVRLPIFVLAALALAVLARVATVDEALDHVPRPDGVHFSAAAVELVSHGSWLVDTGPWRLPPRTLPGASLVMALSQWMAPGRFGLGIFGIWISAVLAVLLAYGLGRRLFSPAVGAVAALVVATSPLHAHYSRQLMSDVPWGTLVLASLYLLVVPPERAWRTAAAGFLCGLGLLFKSSHALIVLSLLVWVVVAALASRRWNRLAPFLAGLAAGLLPALLYNRFVLGAWWTTPYHLYWPGWASASQALNVKYLWSPPILKGWMGNVPYYLFTFLGFDPRPEKMPWVLPVAILFLASLVWPRTRGGALSRSARSFLGLTGLMWLFYGGACFLYSFQDPRFFLPILPATAVAVAVPMARLLGALPRRAAQDIAVLTAVLVLSALAAIRLSAAARTAAHEREVWDGLREAMESYDLLVTDEDPVLLTYFGAWRAEKDLAPLLLEGELWFSQDPEKQWREEGAVVKPYRGTLAVVRDALAGGKNVAVWIRKRHERPLAWELFTRTFELRDVPDTRVPGLQEVVVRRAGAPAVSAPPPEFEPAPEAEAVTAPAIEAEAPPNEIFVPGGTFTLGGEGPAEAVARNRSRPAHPVSLSPFHLDAVEVDTAAYADFLNDLASQDRLAVEAGDGMITVRGLVDEGATPPYCFLDREGNSTHVRWDPARTNAPFDPWERDGVSFAEHPMLNVTWFGAAAFCNWKSGQWNFPPFYRAGTDVNWAVTGQGGGYRLPTEAEWELAASWDGEAKRMFPYGDDWDPLKANCIDAPREVVAIAWPRSAPVESHGPSDARTDGTGPRGHRNMAGNAWEWCHDWYSDYPKETDRDPAGPPTGTIKVVRGGSFQSRMETAWCAFRGIIEPERSMRDIGFRTARSAHVPGSP